MIRIRFDEELGTLVRFSHGITSDVPKEYAIEFFKAVREESPQYHK